MMTFTGFEKVLTNLVATEKTVDELAKKELDIAVRVVAAESWRQCPLDKSPLRQSRLISKPYKKNGEWVVEISYDTPYALRQHEEMSYNHPTPGTKAKYLEDPVMAYSGQFVAQINTALIGYLATGAKLTVI